MPPPVVKNLQDKSTFVHNCIANKNKSNISHFENIYNKRVFNDRKHKIMTILHENSVDFRSLANLKNALFDSEMLRENHLVPLSEWTKEVKYQLKNALDPCEALILEEIQMGDEVNLQKFTDIVDLFFYLPMQKPIMSNDSHNLYYVMSSNVHGAPTHQF